MASQVVRVEPDVAYCDLGLVGVDRAVCLGKAVLLQHVQQRCLARIVQAQENNIGRLLEEAHPLERTLKEIHNEHFCF